MAYVHCHNRDCKWSQDDFWNFHFRKDGLGYFKFTKNLGWNYNPFSLWLGLVIGTYGFRHTGYWRPRFVHEDTIGKHRKIHTWWLIVTSTIYMFRQFSRQVWWTNEEFQGLCKLDDDGYKTYPKCPKCGKEELDVD